MAISVIVAGIMCVLLLYGRVQFTALCIATLLLCGFVIVVRRRFGHRHDGVMSIDVIAQRSRLRDVHAGFKLCFAVGCALICVAADSVPVSLFLLLCMVALTVGAARVPAHAYVSLMTVPAVFILLGAVAILIEISIHPLGLLDVPVGRYYLCVTADGQVRALSLLLKAFASVSCLYFLSLTTPMHRIIAALRRARIPAVVVELMYLIYRYIFVLLETQSQMRTAARARLGTAGWRASMRTLFYTSRGLMLHSLRRASDSFTAMESRCYDGEIRFLEESIALRGTQVAAACGFGALLVALRVIVGSGVF